LSSSEALKAYEWGRVRVASARAFVFASIVAIVSVLAIGRGSAPWALASFVALAFAGWRGGALSRGALRGALGGLVALAVPMSILRPCCDATMIASGSCCTMPSMCGVSGVVLGLAMALVWPKRDASWTRRDHLLAGAGVALGTLSVAAARCSALFVGESVGLAVGLLAGVAASTAVRSLTRVRTSRG
jgi:hypothetical protein